MAEQKSQRFSLKIGNLMLETTQVIPVVLSLIVIVVAALVYQLLQSGRLTSIEIREIQPPLLSVPAVTELERRLGAMEQKLNSLSQAIETSTTDKLDRANVAAMKAEIQALGKDFASLKEIVIESPEKALAIPLLRKDMNALESKQAAVAASTKEQIDRIYDFSKWFLGLMITLAIGLVTMGFVRRPKTDT